MANHLAIIVLLAASLGAAACTPELDDDDDDAVYMLTSGQYLTSGVEVSDTCSNPPLDAGDVEGTLQLVVVGTDTVTIDQLEMARDGNNLFGTDETTQDVGLGCQITQSSVVNGLVTATNTIDLAGQNTVSGSPTCDPANHGFEEFPCYVNVSGTMTYFGPAP